MCVCVCACVRMCVCKWLWIIITIITIKADECAGDTVQKVQADTPIAWRERQLPFCGLQKFL